jgi:NADPH:quinone reductase-like Zn-dependent oxidoreductase
MLPSCIQSVDRHNPSRQRLTCHRANHINGGGVVGSAATQLARHALNLRAVVATASREETVDSCKRMCATHVVDHRKGLVEQVTALELDVPIKYTYDHGSAHPRRILLTIPIRYVYILGPIEQYISAVGKICAPFGKVCSIVQADVGLYRTDLMSKSMTFSRDWLGSAAYHRTNVENYHTMFTALGTLTDEGELVLTLGKRYKLTLAGLREAHHQIESKKTVGKTGPGVDEPGEGIPFT